MCDDKHHNFPQHREGEKKFIHANVRKLIRIKSVKRCRRVEGIYGAHREIERESERKSGTLNAHLQVPIKRELVLITHRQLHKENKHCTTRGEGREKVSPTSKRVLSAAADKKPFFAHDGLPYEPQMRFVGN